MSVDYEYVTIDVDIIVHAKGFAAGVEAMGLWLWGMAWSHKTGANGFLPKHVVVATWGAPPAVVTRLAKRLVTAGLWVPTEDGWLIWNYGKKNQSAEEKERRRALGRERMRRLREKRDAGDAKSDASHPVPVRDESAAPDLICNVSGRSPEPDPAREPGLRPAAVLPDPFGPPPEWWAEAVRAVSENSLGTSDALRPSECWIAYAGHRANKRLPINRNDAGTWLVKVMVEPARTRMREEARAKDRDATFAARFPPKSDIAPMTPYRLVDRDAQPDPTAEELAEVRRLAAKGLPFLDAADNDAPKPTGTDQ